MKVSPPRNREERDPRSCFALGIAMHRAYASARGAGEKRKGGNDRGGMLPRHPPENQQRRRHSRLEVSQFVLGVARKLKMPEWSNQHSLSWEQDVHFFSSFVPDTTDATRRKPDWIYPGRWPRPTVSRKRSSASRPVICTARYFRMQIVGQ